MLHLVCRFIARVITRCIAPAATAFALAACGGNSSSPAPAAPGEAASAVAGVATPSGVSVVTAKNAQ